MKIQFYSIAFLFALTFFGAGKSMAQQTAFGTLYRNNMNLVNPAAIDRLLMSYRAFHPTLQFSANLRKQWSAEADFTNSLKSSENQAFATRNYQLDGWEISPKMTWLPTRGFRIVASMKWELSQNKLLGAERAEQTHWSAEITWNPVSKPDAQGFKAATSLRAKGTFAQIGYTGAPNTAVAFAMLEGLQDGKNFLWNLNLDRQISKSMQLSLNYEGRKTGTNRVVHVARAQVRAVF